MVVQINNYPNFKSSSLIEILSLRYDTTQHSILKKLSWKDFIKKKKLSIKKIENNLNQSIDLSIGKENPDTISIALSGGVDSVLALTILKKKFPKTELHGISIKFSNSTDESKIAKKIANFSRIQHHVLEIDNYLEELPKAISIIKSPFWDIHWYYLAKKAKDFSKFLASGDGGDELFGGYTFRYKKFLSLISDNSKPTEKINAYLQCHERDRVPNQNEIFGEKVNYSMKQIHSILLPYFDNPLSPIEQVFLADYNGKLLYNFSLLNSKINKYFRIKPIIPLLSNQMIEYSTQLPSEYKYDNKKNIGKLPLREIISKYGMDNFVSKKKLGFSVNTKNLWENYGKKICQEFLLDSRTVKDGWINYEWIKNNIKRDDLEINYINKFLGILAFEIWYRIFVTNEMNPNQKL